MSHPQAEVIRVVEAFAECWNRHDMASFAELFAPESKRIILDRVAALANCFPMIPSGKAHNEMLLADDGRDLGDVIDDAGKRLV